MLTDIRPIVERLLRKMVLAGIPLITACDGGRTLTRGDASIGEGDASTGGGGSAAGVGGVAGTFGTAGAPGSGGTMGAGGSTGSGGAMGTGGTGAAIACQPFKLTCGTPTISCYVPGFDGGASTISTVAVTPTTVTYDFDPGYAAWIDLYRACVGSGPKCGPDCEGFCTAVAKANGVGYFNQGFLECEVTCGDPKRLRLAYTSAVCGRRPAGAAGGQPSSADTPIARYLTEAAALEAASVPAFARLVRDLAAHGAPAHLVRAARVATAEEARHWRRTRDVARRRGGDPVRPAVARASFASLEEIAVDNVVEGCVRETFGALVAAHQAATAADPEIRELMTEIAEDELGHAALSWQIDAWVCERLGPAFSERRSQAARAAVGELLVATGDAIAEELCVDAGLPGVAEARALLLAAWETTWKPSFAASGG
jgi:hypothetical protein